MENGKRRVVSTVVLMHDSDRSRNARHVHVVQ